MRPNVMIAESCISSYDLFPRPQLLVIQLKLLDLNGQN